MPHTRQQVADAVEWLSSIPQKGRAWAEALLMAAVDETVGDFGRAVALAKIEHGRGAPPKPGGWEGAGLQSEVQNANPNGCNQHTGPGCATGGSTAPSARDRVAAAVSSAKESVHAQRLAGALKMDPNTVREHLDALAGQGKLRRMSANVYMLPKAAPASAGPPAPKTPRPDQGATREQPPAAATPSSISQETAARHRQGAQSVLDASLSASGVSEASKAEYRRAAEGVLDAMPPAALERYNRYCTGHTFHASLEGMTAAVLTDNPELRGMVPPGAKVGGRYSPAKLSVDVDSGGLALGGKTVAAQGLYAHEFMHAVDGPFKAVSGHPEWRKAWAEEMRSGQMNRYAATQPHEGLAEMGRAMWGGEHDRAAVEKAFPKCVRFLRRSRLWE